MHDFTVTDHGTIIVVMPRTPEAEAFVETGVEVPSWAWVGRGFAVDHSVAEDLINGIVNEGLTVGVGA